MPTRGCEGEVGPSLTCRKFWKRTVGEMASCFCPSPKFLPRPQLSLHHLGFARVLKQIENFGEGKLLNKSQEQRCLFLETYSKYRGLEGKVRSYKKLWRRTETVEKTAVSVLF